MKSANIPNHCHACGNLIAPHEKYAGFKRPGGFELLCAACYAENGHGDINKIRKRFHGTPQTYFNNPEGVIPSRREIKEEQVIIPEELGPGWRLAGRFNELNTAKLFHDDFVKAGIAATIVPARKLRYTGEKTEREKMWAVIIKDPEAREEEPDPFTEEWFEWIRAGKPYTSTMIYPKFVPWQKYPTVGPPITEQNPDFNRIVRTIAKKLRFRGDIRQLKMGIKEEFEHADLIGNDPLKAAKIAMAHLKEDTKYYTKLKRCGLNEGGEYMSNPKEKRYRKPQRQIRLHAGQLTGLSVGMIYTIHDAMRTQKQQRYGHYYVTPMEIGVQINEYDPIKYIIGYECEECDIELLKEAIDVLEHKIKTGHSNIVEVFSKASDELRFRSMDVLVPYKSRVRVEKVINDIESFLRYEGRPKEIVIRELYHKLYPELEPAVYKPVREEIMEEVWLRRPGLTFGIIPAGHRYLPVIYEMGRRIEGPLIKDHKEAVSWLRWQIDEINAAIRNADMTGRPRPRSPRDVPIELTKEEDHDFKVTMRIHELKEPSTVQHRYTLYQMGPISAGVRQNKGVGGIFGWIYNPDRKVRVRMTINQDEIVEMENIVGELNREIGRVRAESRRLGNEISDMSKLLRDNKITKEDFDTKVNESNVQIGFLAEKEKVLLGRVAEVKSKIPAPIEDEREYPAPLLERHFKFYLEAIEWLQRQGIPVNKDMETLFAESRLGPNEPWHSIAARSRVTTFEEEMVPLVDLETYVPPPSRRERREQRPRPDEVVPLTEENPGLGVIGLAAATGLATGMASGATFAAVSSHLQEQREKKKKEEEK